MRATAILSIVVLSASLVAGCGGGGGGGSKSGSSSGSYCNDLKAAKTDFASFQSSTPDFTKFADIVSTFHKLASSAPSEVSDEWKTVDSGFANLEKALSDAGLKFDDLGALMQGQTPAGMSAADMAALAPKLQASFSSLEDPKFQTAATKIEKHAKSACHLTLTTP